MAFWAVCSPKSGVAPARFGDFSADAFLLGFAFNSLIAGTFSACKVQKFVKNEVRNVILATITVAPLRKHSFRLLEGVPSQTRRDGLR